MERTRDKDPQPLENTMSNNGSPDEDSATTPQQDEQRRRNPDTEEPTRDNPSGPVTDSAGDPMIKNK